MFSHHNVIKLEFNNRKIMRKAPNTWELNNTHLNNSMGQSRNLNRNLKKYIKPNENEHIMY